MHALPRGRRLAAPHPRQDRARRGRRCATSTCCCRSRNNILGKTLCAFGDAAATPVLSTIKTFRAEYEAHIREGRCTVPAPWRAALARDGGALTWHAWTALARSSSRHSGYRRLFMLLNFGGRARLHGAQGRRVRAAALRPVPRRARSGLLQPLADIIKLIFKEELRPKAADKLLFYARADPLRHGGVRGVRGRAVRRGDDVLRPARRADPPGGGRRQRRPAGDLRHHVDGRLRHRARRLELEQQVLAARRPALVGADDQLRAVVRPVVRGGDHAGRVAVAAARSSTSAGGLLVRVHPASGTSSSSRSGSSSS